MTSCISVTYIFVFFFFHSIKKKPVILKDSSRVPIQFLNLAFYREELSYQIDSMVLFPALAFFLFKGMARINCIDVFHYRCILTTYSTYIACLFQEDEFVNT